MFKNVVRDVGWSVGLGAEYGALAGLAYAGSFGFVAALLALGDGLGDALAFAGYVTLWAGLVALVVGAALGIVCGLLVGLAAPAVPVGLGGRAATALLVVLALAVAVVAATSGTDPWVVVLGALVVVAWPALFAVPALLLHARAVTRRVHRRSS